MKNSSSRTFVLSSCIFLAASLSAVSVKADGGVSRLACDMSMQKDFMDERDQDLANVKYENDYESFHHALSAGLADKISSIVKDFSAKNPGPINASELPALNQVVADAMAPYKASDSSSYIVFCPPKSTQDGSACKANSDWSDGGLAADGDVDNVLMRTPYFTNDPQRGIVLHIPGWILDYKQVALSDLNADGMYQSLFGQKPNAPKSLSDLKQNVVSHLQSDCQPYKTDISGIADAAVSGSKNVQSASLGESGRQSSPSTRAGSGN